MGSVGGGVPWGGEAAIHLPLVGSERSIRSDSVRPDLVREALPVGGDGWGVGAKGRGRRGRRGGRREGAVIRWPMGGEEAPSDKTQSTQAGCEGW